MYLVKMITNTQGQHSQTISRFDTDTLAKVNYRSQLATLHNASDVLYAVVEILDEYGKELNGYREIVDHRPAPEPTEE